MWLLERHPGDAAMWRSWSMQSERVPADELVYLFNKLRPGQDRGMPILAPAIIPPQDLKGYFDAELVRKRIGACMVGVITTSDEAGVMIGTKPSQKPTYGPQMQKMEPGLFTRLLPNETMDFNSLPADTGFDAVSTQFLRQAAAAAGVMYEHATGDFSRVNYSSWRAGHHGFRRRMERIQWNVVIHMLCRPIAARFNEAAVAAQMVAAAPTWRHTPPGFISVDPYKDAQADLLNLRIGKVSLPQLVEERGYDYVEFLMAYAEGLKQADERQLFGLRARYREHGGRCADRDLDRQQRRRDLFGEGRGLLRDQEGPCCRRNRVVDQQRRWYTSRFRRAGGGSGPGHCC
ncbi:phage portal protein [Sphingomonas sp. CFBP8993]|nr:phage portal protein [Sphingomonas sp. CFBP8993]